MTTITRPLMRYFGGKWVSGPKIIAHFPAHRVYVEPFGGAASVLLQKERAFSEVYNDLDDSMVNVFRVLQAHDTAAELEHRLKYTPFSRREFEAAYGNPKDCIDWARHTLIRSWMGFSSVGVFRRTGFRSNVKYVRRSTPARDWQSFIAHIPNLIDRLAGVAIEKRPAIQVIEGHDETDTLFYLDPPYPHETRMPGVYTFEMSDQDHRYLANFMHQIKGMAIISGYACDLYDQDLYADWERISFWAQADLGRERTEVLWVNDAAQQQLHKDRGTMIQRELFA